MALTEEEIEELAVTLPEFGSVTVDGVTTDYAVFGEGRKGRTLVIVPGLSLKPTVPLAERVSAHYAPFGRDYRIYLIDPRRDVPEGYTLEQFADELAAVLKELGVKEACVFGASMGGMVSQLLTIRHPELVRALALGSTTASHTRVSAENALRWVRLASSAAAGVAGAMGKLTKGLVEHIYSKTAIEKFGPGLYEANSKATKEELTKVARLAGAISKFDCLTDLPGVQVPTYVVGAEGDKMVSPEGSRDIAAAIPNATLFMYGPEMPHAAYDEAPDYTERLWRFFEGTFAE